MKPGFLPSDDSPAGEPQPTGRCVRILRAAGWGAILGLAVGLAALVGVLAVVRQCLPLHISFPPQPWPWYCTDRAYVAIVYLAFPVNLLTNDLATALELTPLSLLLYGLIGALLGAVLGGRCSSAPGS